MFEGYGFGSVKSGKMVQDCVLARSSEFGERMGIILVRRVQSSEKGQFLSPNPGRLGVRIKNWASVWSRIVFLPGVRVQSSEKGRGRTLVRSSGFGERIGPNPGLAGSEFGERKGPNPGSAGSEFRERPVPFSELWQVRSSGKGQGRTMVWQVPSSEKGPGGTLVRQVRSSEKDRFLSPNSEEKKKK